MSVERLTELVTELKTQAGARYKDPAVDPLEQAMARLSGDVFTAAAAVVEALGIAGGTLVSTMTRGEAG